VEADQYDIATSFHCTTEKSNRELYYVNE
jgi:hypothetical protein